MDIKEKGRGSVGRRATEDPHKYVGELGLQLNPVLSMEFRQWAGRIHKLELRGLQELGPIPIIVGQIMHPSQKNPHNMLNSWSQVLRM